MDEELFIADRTTLDRATDLIARFGVYAGEEAALRAGRSRDLGNVIHFCRWRQVERVISLLAAEEAFGTLH